MEEFSKKFLEDVLSRAEELSEPQEDAFTGLFAEYLVEAEECFNVTICNYQKKSKGIKLNAYSFTNDFDELLLFISDFDATTHKRKIGSKRIAEGLNRVYKYYLGAINGLKAEMEESRDYFSFTDLLDHNKDEIRKVKLYLLTNALAENDLPPDRTVNNVSISFHIWDIERLYQFIYQKKGPEQLRISFANKKNNLHLIKTPDHNEVYDSYVGVISGELLAELYNEFGQKLIERNVRSYLQAKGKINKSIRVTIKDEPTMFMAYNNGISTIAEKAIFEDNEKNISVEELVGWQVVNGGQTTASLYHAYKDKIDLSQVFVQMKLTVIKDSERINEIISNISRFANSQNKISASDFTANDPFQVELEKLSRKIWVPHENLRGKSTTKWFYERARGQYLVEVNRQGTPSRKKLFEKQHPKNQILTKTSLAKYLMSWFQYPHIVSRGAETNFVYFTEMNKKNKTPLPDENYYKHAVASAILFKKCDQIISDKNYGGYKANIVTYTISLLSFLDRDMVNFDNIWKTQQISSRIEDRINQLCDIVWDHITTPPVKGTNVTQWCKKEECWTSLFQKFS